MQTADGSPIENVTLMNPLRSITARLHGVSHGPITRLISPDSHSGQALKPFVFLDYFNAEIQPGFGFGMHPHSGIATLTWQPDSDVLYEDTTGQKGILAAGGLEWMNAGGGAWHQGHLMGAGRARGFQLWVAMPPEAENGPSQGHYIAPQGVAVFNLPGVRIRVLLGQFQAGDLIARSPIVTHQDMHCFVVELEAGGHWRHSPPEGHDVGWAFSFDGQPQIQNEPAGSALFQLSASGDILLSAPDAPARVLVGTARPHAHPLVLGSSSVHTSVQALERGQQRIRELGRELHRQGVLRT